MRWVQLCGSLSILWHCLSLGLGWKLTFSVCGHCWVFQICWHIECSTFTALSFRIWNSSTGIPSPPLALFVVMLPKAHLTMHSRMSGSRWVITPSWLSGLWRSFLYSSSVYSCHLFFFFFFFLKWKQQKWVAQSCLTLGDPTAGRFFTIWNTREAQHKSYSVLKLLYLTIIKYCIFCLLKSILR